MKSFYVVPTAMLPESAAGGPALWIDGQLTYFCHPEHYPPWSFESHATSALSLVTIPWGMVSNSEAAEEAFEATLGVVKLPELWDAAAAAPEEAKEFFARELPAEVKDAPALTFVELRKALPRSRQRMLLPW